MHGVHHREVLFVLNVGHHSAVELIHLLSGKDHGEVKS